MTLEVARVSRCQRKCREDAEMKNRGQRGCKEQMGSAGVERGLVGVDLEKQRRWWWKTDEVEHGIFTIH